ncbi:MAG: Shikimate kinase I [Candidatus Rifleibacterium amylolyticum]|nr:MAG: Shikimate kinase I [Candidatus Rifleibacterium amylolyticum]
MPQPIVITGFMGAGKSTAASQLAAENGWQLVCLDRTIEKSCGRSVAEIFADIGEAGFRQIESRLLKQVLADSDEPTIIDAGGGVVLLEQNRLMLKQACVVFLDTCFKELLRRIKDTGEVRPLLAGLDEEGIRQLWEARRQIYVNTADFVVKDMAELSALCSRIVQEVKAK